MPPVYSDALNPGNSDGMVVYSDEANLVGQYPPFSDQVKQAFEGNRAALRSPLSAEGDEFVRGYGQLLEVYIPLQLPGKNEIGSVTLESDLYEILSALDYGFSVTEKIIGELTDGPYAGAVALRSLKTRSPHSITFAQDEYGNLGDTSTLADPAVVDDLVKNRQNKKEAAKAS